MKNKIYFTLMIFLFPVLSYGGLFPEGKKVEFIAITSFIIISLGSIFIYYLIWKSKQGQEKSRKERYVIKSVQITSNGRTFVKSRKIRVAEELPGKKTKARRRS